MTELPRQSTRDTIYWWEVVDVNGAMVGCGYAYGRRGLAAQIAAFAEHAPARDLLTPNPSIQHRLSVREVNSEVLG